MLTAPTAIPDTSMELGCAGNGNSINDWAGHFRIRWACLPRETGEFTTRITVKNSTTVRRARRASPDGSWLQRAG